MPALRKILVATDFSDHSDVALAQATAIARRAHRELTLLHVEETYEHVPTGVVLMDHVAADVQEVIDSIDSRASEHLEQRAEVVRKHGVEVGCRLEHGHPDEVIVQVAEEIDTDLIVLGTHGRKGFVRTLIGSTVEKVIRTTHTNVLVARGDGEHVEEPFRRILVPTDFSDTCEKALRLAMAMAAPTADIELFHAWHVSPGLQASARADVGTLNDFVLEIDAANGARAHELIDRLDTQQMKVEFRQEHGSATSMIHERLDEDTFDLVAVGTHGRRGFRRWILGSVAEATVRHATCSVLVAHADRKLRTAY